MYPASDMPHPSSRSTASSSRVLGFGNNGGCETGCGAPPSSFSPMELRPIPAVVAAKLVIAVISSSEFADFAITNSRDGRSLSKNLSYTTAAGARLPAGSRRPPSPYPRFSGLNHFFHIVLEIKCFNPPWSSLGAPSYGCLPVRFTYSLSVITLVLISCVVATSLARPRLSPM